MVRVLGLVIFINWVKVRTFPRSWEKVFVDQRKFPILYLRFLELFINLLFEFHQFFFDLRVDVSLFLEWSTSKCDDVAIPFWFGFKMMVIVCVLPLDHWTWFTTVVELHAHVIHSIVLSHSLGYLLWTWILLLWLAHVLAVRDLKFFILVTSVSI